MTAGPAEIESDELFRRTFNQAAVGISLTELDGRWAKVNDRMCEIVGYSSTELLTMSYKEITHPEDIEKGQECITRILSGETRDYSMEKRYIHKDGREIWINLTVSLVKNKNKPKYFIAVAEDISAKKSLQLELEKSKRDLEVRVRERTLELTRSNLALKLEILERERIQVERDSFFTLSLDLMVVCDFDGYFTRVNPAFALLLGFPEEEYYSRPAIEFVHPEDRADTLQRSSVLYQGESITGLENRNLCKDGSSRWLSWNVAAFPERKLMYAIARDTTKFKDQERIISDQKAKMIASSKTTSLGRMAATMAHEINNPLTVIYGQACRLKSLSQAGDLNGAKLAKISSSIEQASTRITGVVKALRFFAREGSNDPLEIIPVTQLIEDAVALCRIQFQLADVRFTVQSPESDAKIKCRPAQISQVIFNLLANAYDAVVEREIKNVELTVELAPDRAKIRVVDSGAGIDPEIQRNLFEPFVTNKAIGKGTGLGLNISKHIVEAHLGKLYFENASDRTAFVLELPTARNEA